MMCSGVSPAKLKISFDQTGFFQNVDMEGCGGLGKAEGFGNVQDATGLFAQDFQDDHLIHQSVDAAASTD
jgi:hypothetical protein